MSIFEDRIKLADNESIKIFDFDLDVTPEHVRKMQNQRIRRGEKPLYKGAHKMDCSNTCTQHGESTIYGRMRILAVVPKKPLPLVGVKFAAAICTPTDAPRFRKAIANEILIGRYNMFVRGERLQQPMTGVIAAELASIQDIPGAVVELIELPCWVASNGL